MVRAHHAALDERPEAVEMRRVDLAAHVLAYRVVHGLVLVAQLVETHIATVLIGRDERHGRGHGALHEVVHRDAGHAVHHLTDHVALPRNGADHSHLAAGHAWETAPLVLVAVLVLATHIRLVDLYDAQEATKSLVLHGGSDTHARVPRRLIAPLADDLALARLHLAEDRPLDL